MSFIFKFVDFHVTPKELKNLITDLKSKAKVKPILLSFSGLPQSGKSDAVRCLRENYIEKNVLKQVRGKSGIPTEAVGIKFYEIIAASLSIVRNPIVNEFTAESSFAPVILSAFKEGLLITEEKVPRFDDPSKALLSEISEFNQPDLDEHLCFIYQYLSRKNFIVTDLQQSDEEKKKEEMKQAQFLLKSLPEGIAIVNVWDVTLSESVRYFLAALQGHLYNHHMWLFLDLERDLAHLDKPPKIVQESYARVGSRSHALLMKWRPRLHYLIRSSRMSEDKEKKRKSVCTIFAKHNIKSKPELNERVKELEDKVRPVAKHIGVSSLVDEKIESLDLNVHDDSQRLYQKFQRIISETPFENIPLAWIFLRSLFYRFDWIVIARDDLKLMAKECGIDEKSLSDFCKFYMSFGSVFALSLINPDYQYVIVKPISFLEKLGTLLNPKEDILELYPTIAYGIVPEAACLHLFDGHILAYMDALISLNLAVRVTNQNVELTDEQQPAHTYFYYVPLTRSKDPITTFDWSSVHIITSINTPHIFKQVAFAEYFLKSLPQFKLAESEEPNQTIIKDPSTGTTVTLVSHSPAIRLHLNKPDEHVCSCIVQAYEEIAENARRQGSHITVKYKFVKICAKSRRLSDVQSILSSHYHILPDDKLCTECNDTNTEEDAKLLEAWNKALKNVSNVKCDFY